MSKSNVIQDIKSKIRPNGEQSITGQVLQDVLVESVNLVPEKVSELANDSQYQTKANLDTALASKANASDIPTKTSQLNNDTGFVTSTEVSTNYATKAEIPTKTSQLANDSTYQTKANLDTALATKADKSSLASKQDKLVSGTNIKTINDQSILGSGNISIEAGSSITVDSALSATSENPVQNKVITNTLQTKANASDIPTKVSQLENDSKFATQTAVATGLATKADKDSLTSLEGSVSTLETTVRNQDKSIIANAQAIQGKQDKLVSGTNIKTINNQSLLGSGNISIEGGGTVTVDNALSDTSENPVQNKVITARITSIETSLASKANASDVPTKTSQLENDSTYQTKANLDTALADYATTSEVNSKNTLQDRAIQDNANAIATINQTLESKADTSAIPTKVSQLNNDSGFVTSTEVSTTYATKTDLAGKANTEDVPTKTSQLENDSTYQTKANLDTALESYAKTSDVNSKNASQDEAIQSKQDKLISGTNIKTINNQSLLGEGNISIEAGSSITVDSELSTTSENPVQNKVITTKVNSLETSLGSKANASDIPTKTSQLENDSTYQTKANLDTALEGYATTESVTTEVGKKQDKLVSGTNIKTINSQSLLGEGNISIESTSITVDSALSTTSENPVQNKVVTAELNNKPSYVTKGSKHFLNVTGDLNASGGIYSGDVITTKSTRGALDLNTRGKYTDNKVDIFKWMGNKDDIFTLTADVNAGTKSLSLSDGSSVAAIQYIPDTYSAGKLVHNCNVVLKGDPDGYQPEFQILDYASVIAGSTSKYVSLKCDGGWFKIVWVGGGPTEEVVAISRDEFNVFGENIPLRSDYDSLNTRVTALENSLGSIDTALNTILGNS